MSNRTFNGVIEDAIDAVAEMVLALEEMVGKALAVRAQLVDLLPDDHG